MLINRRVQGTDRKLLDTLRQKHQMEVQQREDKSFTVEDLEASLAFDLLQHKMIDRQSLPDSIDTHKLKL